MKAVKLVAVGMFAVNILLKSEVIGALIVLAVALYIFVKFFGAVFEELERRNGV